MGGWKDDRQQEIGCAFTNKGNPLNTKQAKKELQGEGRRKEMKKAISGKYKTGSIHVSLAHSLLQGIWITWSLPPQFPLCS